MSLNRIAGCCLAAWALGYSALGFAAAPGTLLGTEYPISSHTFDTDTSSSGPSGKVAFDAAQYSNGDFVVAWAGESAGVHTGIFTRQFTVKGTPDPAAYKVNEVPIAGGSLFGHWANWVEVAVGPGKDGAVVWSSEDGLGTFDLRMRLLRPTGKPLGSEILVASGVEEFESLAVAVSDNGYVGVLWGEPFASSSFAVYSPAGELQQIQNLYSGLLAGSGRTATLTWGGKAGFVAAYETYKDAGSNPFAPIDATTTQFTQYSERGAFQRQKAVGPIADDAGYYLYPCVATAAGDAFVVASNRPDFDGWGSQTRMDSSGAQIASINRNYSAHLPAYGYPYCQEMHADKLGYLTMQTPYGWWLLDRNGNWLATLPSGEVAAGGANALDVIRIYQKPVAGGRFGLFGQRYASQRGGTP